MLLLQIRFLPPPAFTLGSCQLQHPSDQPQLTLHWEVSSWDGSPGRAHLELLGLQDGGGSSAGQQGRNIGPIVSGESGEMATGSPKNPAGPYISLLSSSARLLQAQVHL